MQRACHGPNVAALLELEPAYSRALSATAFGTPLARARIVIVSKLQQAGAISS
jgi:hypothetical protein